MDKAIGYILTGLGFSGFIFAVISMFLLKLALPLMAVSCLFLGVAGVYFISEV